MKSRHQDSGPPSILAAAAAFLALAIAGCEEAKPSDPYTGNMSDTTWANQVTAEHIKARVNGRGREVAISEYKGKFVWADYAAPWCQPCLPQAREIARLEKELAARNVVFLTVMTSETGGYGHEPGAATASTWATRTGLDPERVVAATGLTGWTIPTHVLYSPEGHTLYRSTGSLPADRIKTLLFSRMNQWDKWKETGEVADWMWFEN